MADRQVSDFYWQMPWETDSSSILCHNFPYDIYTTKHSCGPDPKTCLSFDFRSLRGEYNGEWNVLLFFPSSLSCGVVFVIYNIVTRKLEMEIT